MMSLDPTREGRRWKAGCLVSAQAALPNYLMNAPRKPFTGPDPGRPSEPILRVGSWPVLPPRTKLDVLLFPGKPTPDLFRMRSDDQLPLTFLNNRFEGGQELIDH